MDVYYINGEIHASQNAVISVNDLGVLRGYGVFDFLRTYGKKPFHLEAHLQRLQRSARLIGLHMPWATDELNTIVHQTLERSQHGEANIRLVVTGGISSDGITPQQDSTLLVMVTALQPMPSEWYRDGVKVITTHDERYCPGAKTINYIPAIIALKRAASQQAIESLYVDRYGRVLEGTTSNLFALQDDVLITPDRDILPGITRDVILRLASDFYPTQLRSIKKEELRLMDELFITSSNKEVLPVVRVDEIVVGNGKPGARTLKIMQAFAEWTQRYAESPHPA